MKDVSMHPRLPLDDATLAHFCERHHIRRLALFGSQLKGTARPDSDIDLLHIRLSGGIDMYIDLGAEKVIAAEKAGRKIAVEIKSFLDPSPLTEFHLTLGQFMNYRYAIADTEPDRLLYLAVPLDIYEEFFTLVFIQSLAGCDSPQLAA
jgi:predicted nucleotidyltransferase